MTALASMKDTAVEDMDDCCGRQKECSGKHRNLVWETLKTLTWLLLALLHYLCMILLLPAHQLMLYINGK